MTALIPNKPEVAAEELSPAAEAVAPSRRNEWRRARETEGVVCQTHIGGQALLEGIMMRGRYNWAVAIRRPDGTIHTEEHELASGRAKNSWMYWPVIRGVTALVESLSLGYRALSIAGEQALDEAVEADERLEEEAAAAWSSNVDETGGFEWPVPEADPETARPQQDVFELGSFVPTSDTSPVAAQTDEAALPKSLLTISMIIGLVLGIAIFVALPALITNLLVGDYSDRTLLWNLVDGLIRIAIFVAYVWLIGRMPDIKTMFGYHGAEHRTIHCYEHGLELTPANAAGFPTLHVRCGTAFMLMTMLIAILVFTLTPIALLIDVIGIYNPVLRFLFVVFSRVLLLPLVAGLAYEVTVKWAGSHPENPLVRFILWPGMQMQRLTTNPPDDSQVECAIVAMQLVLRREELEASRQLAVAGAAGGGSEAGAAAGAPGGGPEAGDSQQ